jgi:hypothetical protein
MIISCSAVQESSTSTGKLLHSYNRVLDFGIYLMNIHAEVTMVSKIREVTQFKCFY